MKRFLEYEQDNGVVTITMNRPEERNALTDFAQFQEFVDVCHRITDDGSVCAVILTGRGSAFCAGGNVKAMQERTGMFSGPVAQLRDNYRHGIQRIPRALYNLEVPTIAAVNGPAIGAGDLACMCDIRIASEAATFAESFVRLGIIPGDGDSWLLQRVVGLSKACEMTFTGDPIDAWGALTCGLVSRVVTPEALLHEARALAERIARNPPNVLRMCKRLIRESQNASLDTILEMAAGFQAIAQQSEDHSDALEKIVGATPKNKKS